MIRTQLNFDERTYYQLVDYARKKKTSLSAAARTLIIKQIEQERGLDANPLLGLVALGKRLKVSGPKDLSERHDFYLYEEPYSQRKKRR